MRLLFILSSLLFLFSCKEESGFIPQIDKNEPFYSEHTPTKLWTTEVSEESDFLPFINGGPQIVGNQVFVLIRSDRLLKSYEYETGQLNWSTNIEPYFEYGTPENYEIVERNETLYLIDKQWGSYISFNKNNGAVLTSKNPESLGLQFLHFFPAIIDGDYFYMMNRIDQGEFSLVKVNFVANSYENVSIINDFEELDEFSDAVLDEQNAKFYFTAIFNRTNKAAFAVDLNSGEFELIWEDEQNYSNSSHIGLIEDILVFENEYDEIIGINKETGDVLWLFDKRFFSPVDKFISTDSRLFINAQDKLFELDLQSGQGIWATEDILTYGGADTYSSEDLIIIGASNFFKIIDMKDGQTLVSLEIPNPESQSVRSFAFDEENGSVVIASYYHLQKYNDLLP